MKRILLALTMMYLYIGATYIEKQAKTKDLIPDNLPILGNLEY